MVTQFHYTLYPKREVDITVIKKLECKTFNSIFDFRLHTSCYFHRAQALGDQLSERTRLYFYHSLSTGTWRSPPPLSLSFCFLPISSFILVSLILWRLSPFYFSYRVYPSSSSLLSFYRVQYSLLQLSCILASCKCACLQS